MRSRSFLKKKRKEKSQAIWKRARRDPAMSASSHSSIHSTLLTGSPKEREENVLVIAVGDSIRRSDGFRITSNPYLFTYNEYLYINREIRVASIETS